MGEFKARYPLGRYQLTFSETVGTKQFHGQESNRFGSLSLSYAF
jgi:hypothetical protein